MPIPTAIPPPAPAPTRARLTCAGCASTWPGWVRLLRSKAPVKIQPTSEQLACLEPLERFHFRLVDVINRSSWFPDLASPFNSVISRLWVEAFIRHLVQDHGFENFKLIDPSRSVLLVANHRSFYDQYSIMGRLYTLYGNHHRIFFPIRSPFFYDSLLGLVVNLSLSFGAMYPPITRDPRRMAWNNFAMEVLGELLLDRRNLVGFHPEGKRNQNPDPYALLPGKLGCGMVIHKSRPNVLPVFLQGFPRSVLSWPIENGRPAHLPAHRQEDDGRHRRDGGAREGDSG
ncbi:hypothetical protein DYH09_26820 [bacterium CPR1]|nr:hypothetical protein [bacterium CPR1]